VKIVCIDCNSIKRQQGKELKIMTIPTQVTLHKRLHPTHLIQEIESDGYNKYGFKFATHIIKLMSNASLFNQIQSPEKIDL
jgi:hypothetical protein